MTLTLSEPTKMLRVDVSCTDTSVTFNSSKVYFKDYDDESITIYIYVSPYAESN